jgi:FtsZ-binding cell division protein ZapB
LGKKGVNVETLQLTSQEKELKALQTTNDRLLQENSLLKAQYERWERELQAILERYKQDNVRLMAQNASLVEIHGNQEGKLVCVLVLWFIYSSSAFNRTGPDAYQIPFQL